MWNLIVSVPDRCLSFYFDLVRNIAFLQEGRVALDRVCSLSSEFAKMQ